jgi:hypothetical protein
VSKTKFAAIGEVMSVPPLEVVDQVAGIVFAGCGPPPRTSTVFCANAVGMANHNTVAEQNTIVSFRIFLSLRQRRLRAVSGCADTIRTNEKHRDRRPHSRAAS